jgi:hypothetical protein
MVERAALASRRRSTDANFPNRNARDSINFLLDCGAAAKYELTSPLQHRT